MKRIRTLRDRPQGLSDYLEIEADDPDWERFRSHEAGVAYQELRRELMNLQHGLCGYCEARLVRPHVQVEHVVPRREPNEGCRRELDQTNMMVCCLGGTKDVGDEEQFLPPVKDNTSCGQSKGAHTDERFVDPRKLPPVPALVRIRDTGEMEVDPNACAATRTPAQNVVHSIGVTAVPTKL